MLGLGLVASVKKAFSELAKKTSTFTCCIPYETLEKIFIPLGLAFHGLIDVVHKMHMEGFRSSLGRQNRLLYALVHGALFCEQGVLFGVERLGLLDESTESFFQFNDRFFDPSESVNDGGFIVRIWIQCPLHNASDKLIF